MQGTSSALKPLAWWKTWIQQGKLDATLALLYGADISDVVLDEKRQRFLDLLDQFANAYGENRTVGLFRVPGRSELLGNHTDHNHGCVIAAAIDADIIAVASPQETSLVRVNSHGFAEDCVDFSEYTHPNPSLFGTSAALIAGVIAGFKNRALPVGGFDACVTSDVPQGSGLSSSAAYENMIGMILSGLYSEKGIDPVTIAMISKEAENQFFSKPCGLMDQVACAVGGVIAIDFENPSAPLIQPLALPNAAEEYRLCIVHTGGSHADLTNEYASIPEEMKAVAASFGKQVLREVPEEEINQAVPTLRERVGDRALLRALHYYAENRRVKSQVDRFCQMTEVNGDDVWHKFLVASTASGHSSFCYLQNIYSIATPSEQGLSLALCMADTLLDGHGSFRVHGGGFAGTIQAFVPMFLLDRFCSVMCGTFGRNACSILRISSTGCMQLPAPSM